MRFTSSFALVALAATLGLAAVAVPAAAQFGPAPPAEPQTGPARIWNDATPETYVPAWPVLSADLGLGDTGAFTGVFQPASNKLCYMLIAPGVSQPTGARIVKADARPRDKAVLTLKNPAGGTSGDCVALKADVLKAIVANPAGYVVEVDNKAYPNGAVRAPLVAWERVARGSDG